MSLAYGSLIGRALGDRWLLERTAGSAYSTHLGSVFEARDLTAANGNAGLVAIRAFDYPVAENASHLAANLRKLGDLYHPNIAKTFLISRDGEILFMVMELLKGKSLTDLIPSTRSVGHVDLAEILPLISGLGAALLYAHNKGFVHGCLRPDNVIATSSHDVKVIDFAIERTISQETGKRFEPGYGHLKNAYASPEQFEGKLPDPRDDIFALGCIVYKLLCGQHPYNMSAIEARQKSVQPRQLGKLGEGQWRAVRRAIALSREERTPSVNEFMSELYATDRGGIFAKVQRFISNRRKGPN